MTRMKALLGGAAALLVVTGLAPGPASAEGLSKNPKSQNIFTDAPLAPAKSWTGFYGRIDAGMASMDTQIGLRAPAPVGTIVDIDGIGATGVVLGGRIGGDIQLGKNSNLLVGVFAGYDHFSRADWNLSIMPAFAGASAHTALDRAWNVGARAGVIVNSMTMMYGLVAYSQLEMENVTVKAGGTTVASIGLPTFTGLQFGGGLETRLGGSWYGSAEYTYGAYDSKGVAVAPGSPMTLHVEPVVHNARVGLTYKFDVRQQ